MQVAISVFNVAIGISINHIRDALSRSNRFKLVQLIRINHDIEDQFFFVTGLLRRLRLGALFDPTKCVILMQSTDDVIVRCGASSTKMTLDDVTRWTSNLNYGVDDSKCKDSVDVISVKADASEETNETVVGSIPASVLMLAKQTVEDRKEKEKEKSQEIAEAKPEETKPVVNEYTNLYWQPEDYSVYENEYEIVEDNSQRLGQASQSAGGSSGLGSSGGGILRSMRESLLRELRRDLNKLTNRSNENGATADAPAASSGGAAAAVAAGIDPKFVNVRPGLALGLITLQAGHRGPKISLHS